MLLPSLLLLASTSHAALVLGVDANTDSLFTFDSTTGVYANAGSLGFAYDFGDAAYDDATGVFYIVEASPTPSLWAYDTYTATFSFRGNLAVNSILAADVDPASGQILAIQHTTGMAYWIDPSTAGTTPIANTHISADGGYWDDARGGLMVNVISLQTFHLVSRSGVATPTPPPTIGGHFSNTDFDLDVGTNQIISHDWSGSRRVHDGTSLNLMSRRTNTYYSDASAIIAASPTIAWTNTLGACPGSLSMQISGMSPNGRVALLGAPSAGLTVLPSGVCAGGLVDLTRPALVGIYSADGSGSLSGSVTWSAQACGRFYQAVDLTTCDRSNVFQP